MIVLSALLLAATPSAPRGNPQASLDRPYTLRAPEPALVELEHVRQIRWGGGLSYLFPRPCVSEIDSSRICPDGGGLALADTARDRLVRVSPLAGLEYRRLDEHAAALDFGLETRGHSGPVSFYLDARMFTEAHEDRNHPSYDFDFVERQDEEASGSAAYTSYSRFRSNFAYDFSWGRLVAARDAAHWGPGLFHNLSFNQAAIPFNHLTFTTHIGPLTVQSLYGRLALDTAWEADATGEHRSLYAHRYEVRLHRNLVFGFTEQLVLHRAEAPFAFVPVVPLFIAKAGEKEQLNNGNLAGDLAWRLAGRGEVYAEFLLDDIQSPGSLFNDHWGNKWAFLAGAHGVTEIGGRDAGLIAEFARVEPWVYTHKLPRGSQTAHFDRPLGNPMGPNSQAATLKAYLRRERAWYASARLDLAWKGTDPGSSLLDLQSSLEPPKRFLHGVGSPDVRYEAFGWVRWGMASVFARLSLGSDPEGAAGIEFRY